MILEKTISPCDIESIILNCFGKNDISLVMTNNTIVLTQISKSKPISDTLIASENVLAKDWLLQEEDEAWKDL